MFPEKTQQDWDLLIYLTGTLLIEEEPLFRQYLYPFPFFPIYLSLFCMTVYKPNKVGKNKEGMTCKTGYRMRKV